MKEKTTSTFVIKKERRCEKMNDNKTEVKYIYCRYIIRNGKRIYPKHARVFRFEV